MNVQALRHRQHEWHRPTLSIWHVHPLCIWHFIPVSRHARHADFVIFALSSGVYLNLLNYWKAESWFHIWKIVLCIPSCNLFMQSRDFMPFSGIPVWLTVDICVFWCQVRNEYTFQKAAVKSLQPHFSFDRFLVQTKLTYNRLARRPTDVR